MRGLFGPLARFLSRMTVANGRGALLFGRCSMATRCAAHALLLLPSLAAVIVAAVKQDEHDGERQSARARARAHAHSEEARY